jgi:hypothetical protein
MPSLVSQRRPCPVKRDEGPRTEETAPQRSGDPSRKLVGKTLIARQRHSDGAELPIPYLCSVRLGMYRVSSLVILYIIFGDIGGF